MASYRGALAEWWLRGRLPIRLQGTLLALLCFSAVVVPRLLPALWGLLALLAAVHVFAIDPKRPLAFLRTPIGIVLCVFVAYLFVNASWAPDPSASFTKAATVLGLVAGAFLIAASFSLLAGDDTRVLARSALLGLMPGIAFLLIEIVFDEPITRFVSNHIAHVFALRKKAHVEGGEVVKIAAFLLNRNATSLVLLLIPFLLFMGALATARRTRAGFVVLLVAAATCVLLSQSGTSVMALFAGALVLGLAAVSLKATRALLVAGWAIATLLAVPLGALPYDLGWQHWTWLPPESVAARFYIWKYTADKVSERPITGIGIRGTRTLHVDIPIDPKTGRQTAYALRPGRHAHNVFLQTWLELGAIGAVLLLGVGLAALWQIRVLPQMLQASAYALFAVCGAVGVSGFDLWQTWLLTSYAFTWSAMLLAARLPVWAPQLPAKARCRQLADDSLPPLDSARHTSPTTPSPAS